MPLIKTTTELQAIGPVEHNLSPTVFAPFILQAERKYLLDILGPDYLAYVQTQYDGGAPDANTAAVLTLIQDVVGSLAIYLMIPILGVRVGNTGLMVTQSDDFNGATPAQIYFLRNAYQRKGLDGIDTLFDFLESNKATYTTWAESSAYVRFKKYFISSARQFQDFVDIGSSRLIYGRLCGIMDNMELRYISGALGPDLYADLKTKWIAGTLSDKEKFLVCGDPALPGGGYVCRAIALYTYQMALKDRNMVEEIMVVNISRSENFRKNKEQYEDFSLLIYDYGALAAGALSDAVNYLNQNASAENFPLWFNNADLYTDPAAIPPQSQYLNDQSNGTFIMM